MPVVLTTFYTAFSPSCFSLLGLWLVIIGINAGTWLNTGRLRRRQVYAVSQFFAAPPGRRTTLVITRMVRSPVTLAVHSFEPVPFRREKTLAGQ